MKTSCIVIVLIAFAALFAGCAIQDDMILLEERLIVLERKNESLQKQLRSKLDQYGKSSEQSEKNLRTNYAGINVSLDNLQQEVRGLNGRLEEIDYQINRQDKATEPLSKKVDELSISMAKMEQRVIQLEQYLSFDGNRKPTPAKPDSGSGKGEGKVSSSDLQIYEDAKAAYDKGEMEKARQGFALLIKTFPKSENADNAQFWIGESYYQEKWYEKAILEYQTVLEKYPKGNKVPAAMLKQGMSFLKIGDKSNARLILKELKKDYPKSNEARIASQKLNEF